MGKRVPRIRRKGLPIRKSGTMMHFMSHPAPYTNPYTYSAFSDETPRKMEIMWDTTGFEDCDFNPCWHEKAYKVGETPIVQEPRFPGAFDQLDPHMFIWAGVGHTIDQISAGRSIPLDLGQWMDDFAASAEYHFKTAVEPAGSLINFLIEAVEICELNINLLEASWKRIRAALDRFFDWLKKHPDEFWLAWNFAIKPTIQDLKEMFNTLKKAQKRLKWLRERNHKNTKVKYREGPRTFTGTCRVPHSQPWKTELVDPVLTPGSAIGYEVDAQPSVELEVSYEAKVTLTSWAWIRFDIDDAYLDEFYGLGIIMMVMQGLYNPGAIVWEATPFSWLIDYFRSQKSKLEQLIASDLSPLKDASILQTGWAIKAEIRCDCTWIINETEDYAERREAGTVMYYLYSRQPGLPTGDSSPFQVNPSIYQLSIILALILGFRRRK